MEKDKLYNVNIDGKVLTNLMFKDSTEDYFIFRTEVGDNIVIEKYRVTSWYDAKEKCYTCSNLIDKLNLYSNKKVRLMIDNGHGTIFSTQFGAELELHESPSGITIEVIDFKDIEEEEY